MRPMNVPPSWVLFATAGLVFAVGWAIRTKQRIEWINGIDAKRVTDRAGLARFVGNLLYAIAATMFAGGVLIARHGPRIEIAIGMGAVAIGLAGWLVIGIQRFETPHR